MLKSKIIATAAVLVMCHTAASAVAPGNALATFLKQPGACERYNDVVNTAQISQTYPVNMMDVILETVEADPAIRLAGAYDNLHKQCAAVLLTRPKTGG